MRGEGTSNLPDDGLIDALHVQQAAEGLADKLKTFGQFVGSRSLACTRTTVDGQEVHMVGELHFGWVLGGRAVQDIWIVPGRGQSGEGKPPLAFPGSTIRFYDSRIDAWRSTWVTKMSRSYGGPSPTLNGIHLHGSEKFLRTGALLGKWKKLCTQPGNRPLEITRILDDQVQWLGQNKERLSMPIEDEKRYPDIPVIARTVQVGGLTKSQLMQKLKQYSMLMNESAERLFADDRFSTSDTKYILQTVELTVGDLGFPDGSPMGGIFKRAIELGLELCPLELGPHLRLAYLDQPEGYLGNPIKQHQAPSGSITIASQILTEEYEFPKGFYLRRINGVLWLRGYRADHLHVWNPDDHFVFCKSNEPLDMTRSVGY